MKSQAELFDQIFDEKCETSLIRFPIKDKEDHLKQKNGNLLIVRYEKFEQALFEHQDNNQERLNSFLLEYVKQEFQNPPLGDYRNVEFDS